MPKQQPPDAPLLPPVEEVAQAIVDIAAAMKRMSATRLRRDAVVILISEHSKVGRPAVRKVLDSLGNMDKVWLKPLEAKKGSTNGTKSN